MAEGAAILDARREAGYLAVLKKAGISEDEIEWVKSRDTLRPLLARMHHAERVGLDLEALSIPRDNAAPDQRAESLYVLDMYQGRLAAQMSQLARPDRSWIERGRAPKPTADRTISW